jgi:sensor histidine kinase YesM
MKIKIKKKNVVIFFAQIAVWLLLLVSPALISYLITSSMASMRDIFCASLSMMVPLMIVYMANFYALVPYVFRKKRYLLYVVVNILLILIVNHHMITVDVSSRSEMERVGFYSFLVTLLILNVLIASCAIGFRYIMNWSDMQMQLKEEKQKNAEAELAWLKNQLNPHFLFNTLNNISSLTQIDADAAQDSIAQLSDLLRYAIYESNKALVPLVNELEFMHNYIDLMKLRCNEETQVNVVFDVKDESMQIAPLIFISLIENAFKHGVSSSKPSMIDIKVKTHDGIISFQCDNTNFPKDDTNRSGSGIGLENTLKRLELLYGRRYEYMQTIENDIYRVAININAQSND